MKKVFIVVLAAIVFMTGCASHIPLVGTVFQKSLPPFQMAIVPPGEKIPLEDFVLTRRFAFDLIDEDRYRVKNMKQLDPTMTTFDQLQGQSLDNQVTLLIYDNEALVVIGANSPGKHMLFASYIMKCFASYGVKCQAVLNTQINTKKLVNNFPVQESESINIGS